ncbi:MAG: HDIG domain-containing protein [Thermincola sp.]|jgi:putative nucleotidyltransferase with HDIG domain|nr:HDIG domain-containing protein [Thermincola sp.]MDT3704296.1 HDIG domain-containing protein [Thermincola sp.]
MAPVLKNLMALLNDKVFPYFRNTTAKRLMIGISFFVLTTTLLSLNFVPERVEIKVGQPSPKTIKANRSIEFEDKIRTADARKRAEESVGKIYDEDSGALERVVADVEGVMNKVKAVSGNPDIVPTDRVRQLKLDIPYVLPGGVYASLAIYDSQIMQQIDTKSGEIIRRAMTKQISEENLGKIKTTVKNEEVAALKLPDDAKVFIEALVDNFLRPNFLYNDKATQDKIKESVEAVMPVRVSVQNGEKIIGEGEIATPDHIQKLEVLGLLKAPVPVSAVIGIAILVGVGMALVMVYLYQHRRVIYDNEGHLVLIALIALGFLALAKTIIAIEIKPDWSTMLGYLVPVAAASMLLAILLDTKLALVVVAILSGFFGIITGNELRFAIVGFISGTAAIYSVSKLSQRSDLAKAGLVYISSVNVLVVIAVELVTRGVNTTSLAIGAIVGLMNGIFSAILTIGVLPYLESAFGITSAVKLLELANPGQPLLKKLLLEAPGTYHHSILVGNLAEAAADAVGGDSLLVRVGAYYHDIGKLRRPYFFIENQLSSENPHDKLNPNLSTLIITSHTKDGSELAREHKMPKPIVDIIEQHHGTSLVSYFFYNALDNEKNERGVNEEDFRYEGPKPQTKEAALVMMADSVEAAVRSLQRPTPGRIEGFVRKVIKDKLQDGQLDECDLTFKDLDIIAGAFVRVLSGIFHTRVEYPETVLKEIERRKARDAGIRKQSAGKSESGQQAT